MYIDVYIYINIYTKVKMETELVKSLLIEFYVMYI